MKVKGIFAVSFIAMMVVGGAYADIASSGYVDEKIDGLATVAKTGAYGDLTGRPTIPTVNNATLTIQKNGATVDTFTANASANKTINITVPTTTNQLTNNSGFITEDDLPDGYTLPVATANALGGVKSGGDITVGTDGAVTVNSATKADSATTAASATKATQDASGNVITSTYAKKTELSAKQNASTAVEVATAGTAVGDSTHPVYVNASGVATKIDKVAAAVKADTATSATTATTATNATNATQDASGNVITETYATKTEVGSKLSSISGSTGGTGNVVTSVSASGSTVSATKGITAEETKNKVTSVRAASSATDTAYPSEKAVATALAAKANTSALSGYATTSALGAVEDKAEAAQSAASAAQTAANGKVTANAAITAGTATKITYDAKGLVTGGASLTASDIPTIPSTKVSGLGTLATKSAVTSAEITDGTITNADIAASAAIAQSKISGLTTALAGKANTADVPTKTSDLTNDSGFITADDLPDGYTLPAATANTLGGVKSGGDITVSSTGAVTVNSATKADSATTATNATNATKATQDASGNVITSTYATKSQITALDSTSTGTGAVVTGVSQTDGKVSVTKGNVKIPFGGQNATDYAAIWVE